MSEATEMKKERIRSAPFLAAVIGGSILKGELIALDAVADIDFAGGARDHPYGRAFFHP